MITYHTCDKRQSAGDHQGDSHGDDLVAIRDWLTEDVVDLRLLAVSYRSRRGGRRGVGIGDNLNVKDVRCETLGRAERGNDHSRVDRFGGGEELGRDVLLSLEAGFVSSSHTDRAHKYCNGRSEATYNVHLALSIVADGQRERRLQARRLVLQEKESLVWALCFAIFLGCQGNCDGILGAERDWGLEGRFGTKSIANLSAKPHVV